MLSDYSNAAQVAKANQLEATDPKPIGVQRFKKTMTHRIKSHRFDFLARLSVQGKSFYLGGFATQAEACQAWDNAAYYVSQKFGVAIRRFNNQSVWGVDSAEKPAPTPTTYKAIEFFTQRLAPRTPTSELVASLSSLGPWIVALESDLKAIRSFVRAAESRLEELRAVLPVIQAEAQAKALLAAVKHEPEDPAPRLTPQELADMGVTEGKPKEAVPASAEPAPAPVPFDPNAVMELKPSP